MPLLGDARRSATCIASARGTFGYGCSITACAKRLPLSGHVVYIELARTYALVDRTGLPKHTDDGITCGLIGETAALLRTGGYGCLARIPNTAARKC